MPERFVPSFLAFLRKDSCLSPIILHLRFATRLASPASPKGVQFPLPARPIREGYSPLALSRLLPHSATSRRETRERNGCPKTPEKRYLRKDNSCESGQTGNGGGIAVSRSESPLPGAAVRVLPRKYYLRSKKPKNPSVLLE